MEVETGAHDALGLLDVGESRAQPGDLRREADGAGAEVVIAVFDEAGQKLAEGIFTADADRPSRARLARSIGGAEHDRGGRVLVALPGAAAADVAEKAVPGVADAAGDRCQRSHPAVVGDAGLERAVMAAHGVRRGNVALDADHEAAGKLVVAARLSAGQPAARRVSAERAAEEQIAGRADDPFRRIAAQPAGMAADVAAGPAPGRHRGRR